VEPSVWINFAASELTRADCLRRCGQAASVRRARTHKRTRPKAIGAKPNDDAPRSIFPGHTDCCLSFGPSNRHLPQAQVTSDPRETRSTAGGPVHFGDVTACGHCVLAGAHRLDGRSRLDGLVLGVPSGLAEVDRSRLDCYCLRAAGVDFPLPWEKPDGYGGHTAKAHAGYTWPLSLGPASVLRFRRVACARGFFDRGELVILCDRRCAVLSVDHPNADRRREPVGPLWGQLSSVHGTDRALFT
jgi:hypothetical protein